MDKLCMLVCPFIKREVATALKLEGFNEIAVVTFPPKCHGAQLEWADIAQTLPSGVDYSQIVVVGSYCLAGLQNPAKGLEGCHIHQLAQCFSLLTNQDIINGYLKEGTYLLTPGWLVSWRTRVDEWGFDCKRDGEMVREFFAESAGKLLLLDTGVDEKSYEHLQEFADFVGLPFDITPIGLDFLRLFLAKIVLKWRMESYERETSVLLETSQKQTSEYATAMDLLNNFTQTMTELEVVSQIFDIFTMLFAPKNLFYLPIQNERPEKVLYQGFLSESEEETIRNRLAGFNKDYDWTESGKGFCLRINYQTKAIAILEVEQITFSEYREHYLNLALSIIGVCGLAIHNGRIYQKHKRAQAMLQQYARELEQANNEVKQFAYIISHDLRAPLVNIKGFSGELRYALDEINSALESAFPHLNEKQKESVNMAFEEDIPEAFRFIELSVNRMDGFINALLKLSRLGRHEFKLTQVDIRSVVEAVLKDIAHQLDERNAKVIIGPLPAVIADQTAMEQILGNLLNNTVKYWRPERPLEIEITAETAENETIIHVRDNGRGIAKDDLNKIFAPFQRAGKENVPGEGMGLAYVQTMVRRHRGGIACESEQGTGTIFTFTISKKLQKGDHHG